MRSWIRERTRTAVLVALATTLVPPSAARSQDVDRMRDRGPGIATSMFGTYIEPGQLLFYPFLEHYRDSNYEYSPEELGYGLDVDYRGKYRATEGLIFIAYGISPRLAVEVEAAVITARQEKAPDDPTAVPAVIEESGLGDVEGQLRWRWTQENERRPEIFSYFETVFPLQKSRLLIGTPAWEFKLGTGVSRAFGFGTMTLRLAAEYDGAEKVIEAGEYAVEYLRRVSPALRVYLGLEGSQDEVEVIPELQWFLKPNLQLKLNSAFGATSKATDWAPEVGLMFSFR
jgi:hypothetical protein